MENDVVIDIHKDTGSSKKVTPKANCHSRQKTVFLKE